jgi:Zn-dependent peptidase ImmA (M78 family)
VSRRDAERDAQELLLTAWSPDGQDVPLPVDPIRIARRLGIQVYTVVLEEGMSGMLIKRPGEDPEIYLNGNDSANRRRFTCAHELGHYYSRVASGAENWECIDRRDPLASKGVNRDEIYANQFAASLLMPKHLVKTMEKEYSRATLAYKFGVSADAMSYRLTNLRN